MYLHAFVDGNHWNHAYYIVENEERYFSKGKSQSDSMENEMLAMLSLLKSKTAERVSGMTIFSDNEGVVHASRRATWRFKNLDSPLEPLRIAIREALLNLPYKPRIVLIEDSFNLAHRVANNKTVLLASGTKLQPLPNLDRRERRRRSFFGANERILTAEAQYLKGIQQGIKNA